MNLTSVDDILLNIKSVDANTCEGGAQLFDELEYPPQGRQQNFGHPAYQSGWFQHFDYPTYTHQGGPQHFTQLTTHIEKNEHHFGHTTHIPQRDGSGSNNQSIFKLFGKEIYVGDQGVYSENKMSKNKII
ncbi:unnamed protein product [Meloidogyne enterolobii]|uniref:Uncharacterized protein n=1 Tax=Meloidogyne enterolobii TaxID=390850 RepID=A0ACB0YA04_MELEN